MRSVRSASPVTVVTEDGTMGARGFVTDALPEGGTYVYACGPMPMLQALCSATPLDGQLSLEARMGCGFGACMGCTCETTHGSKRVCKDGPGVHKGGDRMAATAVTLCGIELENPVIPASGTFGYGQEFARAV